MTKPKRLVEAFWPEIELGNFVWYEIPGFGKFYFLKDDWHENEDEIIDQLAAEYRYG